MIEKMMYPRIFKFHVSFVIEKIRKENKFVI